MVGSVVLFAFEATTKGESSKVAPPFATADHQLQLTHLNPTSSHKVIYSFIAIIIGLLCPLLYTFKAFAIRKWCNNYKAWDVGVDALICQHVVFCFMFIAYLTYTPWRWEEFIYGQIVGVMYLIGMQSLTLAYAEGPGGPVSTIIVS